MVALIIDPTAAKAVAAWKAAKFCRDLGLQQVIIEGVNALKIGHSLQQETSCWN
jgi:hypothetical protein